jgi:hypothetical protein
MSLMIYGMSGVGKSLLYRRLVVELENQDTNKILKLAPTNQASNIING